MSGVNQERTMQVTYINRGNAGREYSQLVLRKALDPAPAEPLVASIKIVQKVGPDGCHSNDVRLTARQARHLAKTLLDFAGPGAADEPDIIEAP